MKTIDLNCDVGEGMNNEAELMPYLSSCNIACGVHAGDEEIMAMVIKLAMKHGVAIGAHPSFDDRANFGRREMNVSDEDLHRLIHTQVQKLKSLAESLGAKLHHVKPHGALYNMAAKSEAISSVIVDTMISIDSSLALMGLANSEMETASRGKLKFIAEGFADRKYASSQALKSRNENGVISDFKDIASQLDLVLNKGMIQTDQGLFPLSIESLCLHGDTPGAANLISQIHAYVVSQGFEIKPA